MSVVVKDPQNVGKAIVFVKGADSSILPLIAKSEVSNKMKVEANVELFASKGYRTLCFGKKVIDWDGKRDINDIASAEFECDLTLLGATGVEDLL
jgi:magnesium-transporting ATPase (P-type)